LLLYLRDKLQLERFKEIGNVLFTESKTFQLNIQEKFLPKIKEKFYSLKTFFLNKRQKKLLQVKDEEN